MENNPISIPDHKLCGFLCPVLQIAPPNHQTLAPNTPCRIFSDGFKTENGIILSIIDSIPNSDGLLSSRKKWGRIGVVNGSISVVHQLHWLLVSKCLEMEARVVRAVVGENGEIRVVLVVDVYLPVAVWEGWQFPKGKSTAAALFRHLSCDWEARSSMMKFDKPNQDDNDSIWNLPSCHVLECKQNCSVPYLSKKKLFELHEIFKSIPTVVKSEDPSLSRVNPADASCLSGVWVLTDDLLLNILTALGPLDLFRVSATCHHLRFLAASVMPCMKLKLFPHQYAAVEWMLHRERDSKVLPHPLYMDFLTEDGFSFFVNVVSGEIVSGTVPTVRDFRGGMFCDEPGLGKTITTLSLILKTQGTLAEIPEGVKVTWCKHNTDLRCGYYELNGDNFTCGRGLSGKRFVGQSPQRGLVSPNKGISTKENSECSSSTDSSPHKEMKLSIVSTTPSTHVRCTRSSWSSVRRNLLDTYDEILDFPIEKVGRRLGKRERASNGSRHGPIENRDGKSYVSPYKGKKSKKATADYTEQNVSLDNGNKSKEDTADYTEQNETWVQCDACSKWRKLSDSSVADTTSAWWCRMNTDPLHQDCSIPEESYDNHEPITYLPGFYTKETSSGKEENVAFFITVLKEHYTSLNTETKKALTWLAKLSADDLSKMETIGLLYPFMVTQVTCGGVTHEFHKVFQAFGLVKRVEKNTTSWFYPKPLLNLVFDSDALGTALCEPLNSFRLYLSRATLVVVPSNLVDHWKTQIQNHVRPGQLRVLVWTDHKRPRAHDLAWDFDVVITTFSRLSAEWSPRKRSVLLQVHWLRVVFDEGHTLGSSLNLTNKMQISMSLVASNRWLLTGTPTPNTPNSQLSHLQPMLKFLGEEAYGQNQKSWEAGILRPFEAEMEEGRSRLLQLLHRCMISARKTDLKTIPPCIKKVVFVNFTEEHAKSYNELVVTVRRNILMADWNDPSHVESLLNPKQWKFRSTLIRNVRLSCCVAGHIKVTDAGQDIQETMDILVENGLDPVSEEYAFIRYNILNGGSCMRCQEWCRLPVITPCRHLLCLDCVALESERCTYPGCGYLYEMQSPEILTRPENPNPKWPVPKDLIELQPSYKQDDWHPEWESTSSSKVAYLVNRLKELQEANKMIDYPMEERTDVKSIDEILFPNKINESYDRPCNKIPTEKVLIFSQFLEHIHVIEQQLTFAGIKFAGMYSPMHAINKMKSLATFQHDEDCMALLMDGSAALGLDLSFVTHVFLMEPIWDKSMEEQVISRAHRMGATRPILVETLAMHGTIEEQMMKFLQDADQCRRLLKEEFGKNDREGSRAHRSLHDFAESNYLAQLSFVRTRH